MSAIIAGAPGLLIGGLVGGLRWKSAGAAILGGVIGLLLSLAAAIGGLILLVK